MVVEDVFFLLFIVGGCTFLLIGILFMFGYHIVCKRLLKMDIRLTIGAQFLTILLVAYFLLVLIVTLILRSKTNSQNGSIILNPIYSYRSAWINSSISEWRNIILNIAMFIPFGILLPIIFNRFRVVSNILKLTVLMSVLIEVIQLILRRGIFETSDVIHNTMGGLIGFGFFCFIYRLLYIRPINIRKLIISLLPLIVVLFTFMSLALIYNFQEFGIMRQAYISRNNMDNVALRTECDFSDNNTNAMVYSSVGIASERQIDDFAEQFFSRQGVKYDENQTLKVKKNVAYYMAKNSAGEELHLGIDYLALTYTYENFSSSDHDIVNVEKELLIDKLKEFGVDIPENAIYTRDKDGKNHFEIKNDVNGEMAVYGWLDCMFYDDESIKMICNHLVKCKPLREMKIFSEREAYEKIQKGLFRYDLDEPIETITINAVELIYEMDTKGFLQPVYKFEAIVNEEKELDILIPALK